MTEIKINPGSIPRLSGRIREMVQRLEDMTPVLTRRAALLSTLIDDSFRQSRSPTGEVWAPLDDSTVDKRRQNSNKPLVDTAQLRRSVNTRATKGGVVFGVSGAATKYAGFHVTGTKHMPRRAFVPMSADGKPDFSSGPAADWLNKTESDVIRYVLHGENHR